MNILVLGANGMAGHMICLYLQEKGYNITGLVKKESQLYPCIIGDARDKKQIETLFHDVQYDIVINCIGILNRAVDTHLSDGIYLNSVFPHFLAELLQDKKSKLIHISTDCVFSGDKGAYTEKDRQDADSYYGRTKTLGEVKDGKNLTFRTSIVGPELKDSGIGLLDWFLNQTGTVKGFTRAMWTGVTTLELAKAIEASISQNVVGLYHLVNKEVISKYDLLCLFNKYLNENRVDIKPDNTISIDKSLVNTRTDFDYTVASYQQMIYELKEWMEQHQSLYARYNRNN
ncbi:MAG: SDR family oxidoreductase [Lachnospiraceae bacterium]